MNPTDTTSGNTANYVLETEDITYQELKTRLTATTEDFQNGVITPDILATNMIEIYVMAGERVKELTKPYTNLQDLSKEELTKALVLLQRDNFKTDAGQAYTTTPKPKVSYDAQSLDTLCLADESINELLSPFRSVTEGVGRLTIRGR